MFFFFTNNFNENSFQSQNFKEFHQLNSMLHRWENIVVKLFPLLYFLLLSVKAAIICKKIDLFGKNIMKKKFMEIIFYIYLFSVINRYLYNIFYYLIDIF